MKVLVPVDGSDCSVRALRFGVEFARRFEADLDVVHFTDSHGSDTDDLLDRMRAVLDEEGVEGTPTVETDLHLSSVGTNNRIGEDVLELVEEEGYDHVVMGHHGTGVLGKVLLGSAAQTALEAGTVRVTTVP